jgi:repressor LexA
MELLGITKKQHECLMFIDKYILRNGYSPSYEEIMKGLGIKSKSGVHRMTTALVERGRIRMKNGGHRSIEVAPVPKRKTPKYGE